MKFCERDLLSISDRERRKSGSACRCCRVCIIYSENYFCEATECKRSDVAPDEGVAKCASLQHNFTRREVACPHSFIPICVDTLRPNG